MKTYYTWLLLLFITMITGCKSYEGFSIDSTQDIEEYRYLDFHRPCDGAAYVHTSPDKIPLEDRKIISEAFGRLKMREKADGNYEWIQKSGKEVNISEDVFKFFQSILDNSNNAQWRKRKPVYNKEGKQLIR